MAIRPTMLVLGGVLALVHDAEGARHLFRSGFDVATCQDGREQEAERCDDGNADDHDGCTSSCVRAPVCDETLVPDASAFAVDAVRGHCYAITDAVSLTYFEASGSCASLGGYLPTLTSAAEADLAADLATPGQTPWIGAEDDAVTSDATFSWVTGEPFVYTRFAPGEPDDDAGLGGSGDCLHLGADGSWADTHCSFAGFVVGRMCEFEVEQP